MGLENAAGAKLQYSIQYALVCQCAHTQHPEHRPHPPFGLSDKTRQRGEGH